MGGPRELDKKTKSRNAAIREIDVYPFMRLVKSLLYPSLLSHATFYTRIIKTVVTAKL